MEKKRKSPKAARDANPQNAERKRMREKEYHEKKVIKGSKVEKGFKNPPKLIKSSKAEIYSMNKKLKKHFKKQPK